MSVRGGWRAGGCSRVQIGLTAASEAHSAADSCSDKYSRAPLTLEPSSGTLKLLNGQISSLKTKVALGDCV